MQQNNKRPVIFGEVLFDTFPDGASVLGGAPFNVAWHLQGFGERPLLISRVGNDVPGNQVFQTMRQWGLDVSGVQRDDDHPTGAVQVTLEQGQPTFSILPDQAYDHIVSDVAQNAIASIKPALLYHGTLAARDDVSRECLLALRDSSGAPVFVDINLRPPWWDHSLLELLLPGARWVKLNDDELRQMAVTASSEGDDQRHDADVLRRRFDLSMLIVTQGADGAFVVQDEGIERGTPVPVDTLVDTVGAGDAFSSVLLLGLLRGWTVSRILPRALEFASAVCANRGAVIPDQDIYRSFLESWRER